MLAAANRLRKAESFRNVIRSGVKAGRSTLVIHMIETNRAESRAGFVVSKAVGNAVIRNRVKRQLRHLVAAEFKSIACGDLVDHHVDVVVRANPMAGKITVTNDSNHQLRQDFISAYRDVWQQCQKRAVA